MGRKSGNCMLNNDHTLDITSYRAYIVACIFIFICLRFGYQFRGCRRFGYHFLMISPFWFVSVLGVHVFTVAVSVCRRFEF